MLILYKLIDRRFERINIDKLDLNEFTRLLYDTSNFLLDDNDVSKFQDLGIDVRKEALYRAFSTDCCVRRQYLRHDRDPLALAGGLSKALVHGSRDNVRVDKSLPSGGFAAKDFTILIDKLVTDEVEVRCGTAARLLSYIGLLKGWSSRVLHFKSPEALIGQSHVMTEFYIPETKRSVLIDVDFGCIFLFNGKALSYYQVFSLLKNCKKIDIHFFSCSKKYGIDGILNDYIYNASMGSYEFLTEVLMSGSVSTALWQELDGEFALLPTETLRDWTP